MPRLDRDRAERLLPIKGTPPSLINVPQGCAVPPALRVRRSCTEGRSETERPELREIAAGHLVACHLTARSGSDLDERDRAEAVNE